MRVSIPLWFILTLIVMTLAVLPASGVTVRDTSIALSLEPGTITTIPIVFSLSPNESEGDFTVDVLGLGQSPMDGNYTGLGAAEDTSPFSARSLITTGSPFVHLNHEEQAEVIATITVPSDVKDGGRYAIIVVRPATSLSNQSAMHATAVAIPVFLTMKEGTTKETGEITAIVYTTTGTGDGLEIAAMFQNTGNHHYSGIVNNVIISDERGSVVARVNTTPSGWALIPGQEVRFSTAIQSCLPYGAYILTCRVEKHDGSLLAEQKEPLRAGEAGDICPAPTPPGAPGFGSGIALSAIAYGVWGVRKARYLASDET